MNDFMDIMNGRDKEKEKSDKSRYYRRESWGSPSTMQRVKRLREIGIYFEQMAADIRSTQRFEGTKQVSGLTQFRNGLPYQTQRAVQNVCYGTASLLYHFDQLFPGATLFLGDLTSDYNERHFRSLKQKSGEHTIEAFQASEARGTFINDTKCRHFIESGSTKHAGRSRGKRLKGNCGNGEVIGGMELNVRVPVRKLMAGGKNNRQRSQTHLPSGM